MLTKDVLATTHIAPDGLKLARSLLDDFALEMTSGSWAHPIDVEHDPSVPPIGKTLRCHVEPLEDGEYGLVSVTEIFVDPEVIELPGGDFGFQFISKFDSRPFLPIRSELPDNFTVSVGNGAFVSSVAKAEFEATVKEYSGFVLGQPHIRRSLTPDPLLAIILPAWFLTTLTAKTLNKLSDRLSDRLADDLTRLYDVARSAAITFAKTIHNRNRLVTYVFALSGKPDVEFVAKLIDPQPLGIALTIDSVSGPIQTAIEFSKTMNASKVQFLLHESSGWQFNFLTTRNGEVIGTDASFSRLVRRIDMLKESHPELRSLMYESWNHWNQMKQDRTDGLISENVSNDSP